MHLESLALTGGSASVFGEVTQDPRVARSSLSAVDCRFSDSDRGLFGDFAALDLEGGEISSNRVNGLSLLHGADIRIDTVRVHGNAGVGLFIDARDYDGTSPRGMVIIASSVIENNPKGGIDFVGKRDRLAIQGNIIRANGVYGVSVDLADTVSISKNRLESTGLGSDGRWGHGLRVFSSTGVQISDNVVSGNAGGALSAYGCDDAGSDGPVSASLRNNVMTIPDGALELVHDVLPGCASAPGGWWTDLGGNSCNGATCHSQSSSLAPASAPEHTP